MTSPPEMVPLIEPEMVFEGELGTPEDGEVETD